MGNGVVKDVAANDRLQMESVFPSSSLAGMREFVGKAPALSPLLRELLHIRLILDASIVQSELRWRLRRRRSSGAKSSLHEAIDSGVVVAIAPTFLKCEIEEHLGRIATDLWVPIARAQQEWEELQAHVYFYQPNPSNDRGVLVVDPDDLPYKNACEELAGTAVYSRDTDFIAMKVPVVTDCLDLTPRAHARAGSVAIGTTLGSSLTLVIGTESLAALYRLVKSILEGFRRLPGLAQIVIAGGVLAMFAHPKSRAKLLDIWWSFCATANAAKDPVLELTAEVANQFFSASATVTQTYKAIQSALPAHRKPSAIMLARTICLISREPLSLAEIERWMRNEGYSTRSRTFAFYLRRVMRASGQFVEVSPGYWTIHALT